jgi:acetyl esterase/lipase
VDIMATLAEVLGATLPANAGEDSVSLMSLLRGGDRPVHAAVVHHSSSGVFAVRAGVWKLIFGPGGGAPDGTSPHLYDLAADLRESRNLAAERPEEVRRLTGLMEKMVADGRSTPGAKQTNDVLVTIVRPVKKANPPAKKADPPAKQGVPPAPRVIVYREASDDKLKLHVYAPLDAQPADRRTAIVFFFGGGWTSANPTQFEPFARHFAGKGCVTICADYRVASKHRTTPVDAVRDAKAAVRYVRGHAAELGIDPNRIVVSGGSAGGHLAACTTLIPGLTDGKDADSAANALVLFNPVLDTTAGKRGDELKGVSPLGHVRPGLPPTIVFHGTADKTVPFAQAEAFTKAMTAAKNVCELVPLDGRGHGFFNSPEFRKAATGDDYEACLRHTSAFLEQHKFLPARPTTP